MKLFRQTTATMATGVSAIAFAFTLLGPASPAQAGVAFRVQSAVNGKCMQWNGFNRAVTLTTCKHTWVQIWSPEGTQLASDANQYGAWCHHLASRLIVGTRTNGSACSAAGRT